MAQSGLHSPVVLGDLALDLPGRVVQSAKAHPGRMPSRPGRMPSRPGRMPSRWASSWHTWRTGTPTRPAAARNIASDPLLPAMTPTPPERRPGQATTPGHRRRGRAAFGRKVTAHHVDKHVSKAPQEAPPVIGRGLWPGWARTSEACADWYLTQPGLPGSPVVSGVVTGRGLGRRVAASSRSVRCPRRGHRPGRGRSGPFRT
jgi:hypothetical protein